MCMGDVTEKLRWCAECTRPRCLISLTVGGPPACAIVRDMIVNYKLKVPSTDKGGCNPRRTAEHAVRGAPYARFSLSPPAGAVQEIRGVPWKAEQRFR